MTAWSYSSIKTFEQCPKKYYHLKVAKDVKDTGNAATYYGGGIHKAAESFIASGTPVPTKFKQLTPTLEKLNAISGEKHCELKLAVAFDGAQYTPTTFYAADVWWRGIQNALIKPRNLQVWRIPADTAQALVGLAERSMSLQATVQEGVLMLGNARGTVNVECERWR